MDVLNLPDKGKARGSGGSGLGTSGGIVVLNAIKKNGILLFTDGNSLLFCIVLCLTPLGIWHNYSSFLSGGSHCVYQL